VQGEIPCHRVSESDKFLAFLDIMPLMEGHVLIIPKIEVDYIFDLEDSLLGEMMVFAKQVAHKIKKAYPCNRIGVSVIGLEVPHAHIHLVPMDTLSDMNFANEKLELSSSDLAEIAENIRCA
jgi:histidine triad (HIT) family protein